MLTLAVDTATERQSVALAEAGQVLGEVRLAAPGGRHSQRLMPSIAFLLQTFGIAPSEIRALAVTIGPGSFTGLRVGISAVQGLALAGSLPCAALGTLDVMAETPPVKAAALSLQSAKSREPGRIHSGAAENAPVIAVVLDAFRGQVYAALYDAAGRPAGEARAETPEALIARLPEVVVLVGEGAVKHRAALEAARPRAQFAPGEPYLAATLARLAAPRIAAGHVLAAAALRPKYLREADIGRCPPA